MEVLEKIKKIEGVAEAYACYGEWDLFAILKGTSRIVDEANMKIRGVPKVLRTVTFVAHAAVPSHRPYLR
jgi:DNA-binding Lrp family transcriptional regulator